MTKKKRTYNPRLFKGQHSYTLAEIAEKLNRHVNTIQRWPSMGLFVQDRATRPFLIMGNDLKTFLNQKTQKRKHTIQLGEFYCTTCRCARHSHWDKISIENTDKLLGKTAKQVFIKGICEICGRSLTLFTSDRKVDVWVKKNQALSQQEAILNGYSLSSLNINNAEVKKHDYQS